MKKILFVLVHVLLVSSLLLGCGSSSKPDAISKVDKEAVTQSAIITHPPTKHPTVTPTMTAEVKEEPSPTPEPEPTEEPTPTPTPTQQPLLPALGQAPINASSLDQLELLAKLGYGRINQLDYHQDAGVFILKTALGVYLYDGVSLDRIAFFENYADIYQVPGKTQLVAVTPEQTLVLIDLPSGETIQAMMPEGANRIERISFSQDGKMMGMIVVQDHEVRLNWEQSRIDIWDLERNEQVAKLLSDIFDCHSMTFTDDNTQLLTRCFPSGGGIDRIIMWNIPDQEISWSISDAGGFTNFPFSKDGSLFTTRVLFDPITGSSQITIRRSLDGSEIGRVGGKLNDNAFSHDSQHIITTSSGQVIVWHTTDAQRVKAFGTDVNSATYSEDGQHILVNGGEQAWDAVEFVLDEEYHYEEPVIPEVSMSLWRQIGHLDGIRGVEVLDDQMMVWGLSEDEDPFSEKDVIWWWYPDTDIYEEVSIGKGKGTPVLSPERDKFAICTDGGLKIFAWYQNEFETYPYCKADNNYLAFSKNGELLFLNSGILINVIALENGEILQQLRVHDSNVGNIQISDDGNYLVTSDIGITRGACETILWELNPVKFIRKWIISIQAYPSECLVSAEFNHDGSNLVTVHDRVSIWRVSDGWYLKYFDGTAVAFSHDESLLAVGTRASQINFYETDSWEMLETIDLINNDQPPDPYEFLFFPPGVSSGVKDLLFANKGQLLISILQDDVIQLWGVP